MKTSQNIVDENSILNELEKLKQKDYSFSSGQILGSMCTSPHPIAKKAYLEFLETNLGDPELFPGTKEIESRLIDFILNLLHAPKNSTGLIVSGGTESNITAMWLAKQLTKKREIIIPESAHFSFIKIASLMDMKIKKIKLNNDYCSDIHHIKKEINNDTAAILGIAGSTELGTVDPIQEISNICTDENIFLHVDAAFGGFVIPFLKKLNYDVPEFDFNLKGVSTISIDSHKMGYSAIPLGALIIRKKDWLDEISTESQCISSKKLPGILGTRSGGPVASAYAVTKYLGVKGYTDLVEECMEKTDYTKDKLEEIGLNLVVEPTMNVLGVKLRHLSEIVRKLNECNWKVNQIDRLSCIRIVLMPHVTKNIIDQFILDLKRICIEVGEI